MSGRGIFARFDLVLMLVPIGISLIGVVLIASATHTDTRYVGLWEKQALVLGLGALAMIIASVLDYRLIVRFATPIFVLIVVALVIVNIIGRIRGGAQSWFAVAGLTVQPSEFAKLAIVLMLAHYFSKLEKSVLSLTDLIKPGMILAVPLVLTALQPDMGTAFTMLPIFLGMVFVFGIRKRTIIALVLIALLLVGMVWMFMLKDYQRERLRTFMSPDDDPRKSGYQINQSLIAIGSGGFAGKGLFLGSQSQLNFVPAQHTDFVFSVLGEELGFLGVLFVLVLYGTLFTRSLLPLRDTHNLPGIFIVVGVVSYLAFQTFINVLMSIGLFPTTGVPLPYLSYGGSALLTNLTAVGLVLSVYTHQGEY